MLTSPVPPLLPLCAAGLAAVLLAQIALAQTDGLRSSAVDGLWQYKTIARRGQPAVPLDGYFLLRDGRWIQHSLNRGTPIDRQLAQGHLGTFVLGADSMLTLRAEVGFIVDPEASPAFVPRAGEHHARAVIQGDQLTLSFGTATIQVLTRVPADRVEILRLDHGELAIVSGRFLLVHADGTRALTASGEARREGDAITLRASPWVMRAAGAAAIAYDRERTVRVAVRAKDLDIPGYGTVARTPSNAR